MSSGARVATAMILAAGRGERLMPVTRRLPKALVQVHGLSLLERQLGRLARAGVETVVINLGWLGEMIVERIGSGRRFGVQVAYSPEYDNVLETGGGILKALPLLGHRPFWVVNADVFSDFELPDIRLQPGQLGHLVLVPKPGHKARGDFDLVDGRVRNVSEPPFTFSGMAVYDPALFAAREPGRFPLAPLLFAAADQDALSGEIYAGVWEDVGTVERLQRLNET